MELSSSFSFLTGFLTLLPELVVFAACIYYLSKRRGPDSILMFLGTLLSVLIGVFHRLVIPLISFTGELMSNYTMMYSITSVFGFISGTLFAIGLFMAIAKWAKSSNNHETI